MREQILKEALSLSAQDRVEIVKVLLSSLDEPDSALNAPWGKET